ncbi:hypothetical protein OY671_009054, partial [Metschnikowia pulcherrima]
MEESGKAIAIEPYLQTAVIGGGASKAAGGAMADASIPGIIGGDVIFAFAYAEPKGRYDSARAYLAEVRAGSFPQIGAQATVTQNRQSDNRPSRGQKQPDLYAADTSGAQVSYEADLWGRVRNSVAAGRADAEASADDSAAVRVSSQAQLATDYIASRGYDREIDSSQRTVDAYSRADAMTRRRFAGGIANGMETGQSATQLAEAQGQLADSRNARA